MKYKVLRDCHYVNRYWNEGEIAEFPNDVTPNEHFKTFEGHIDETMVVEVPVEAVTMSALNEQRKNIQPKTGMGYVPPEKITEPEVVIEQKVERKKPGPKPKYK